MFKSKKLGLTTMFLSLYLVKYAKLKIGIINIDWFRKSKKSKEQILKEILAQEFDFLIVNENILNFKLAENYFEYHSKTIPTDTEFQHLNYRLYLKGKTPIRSSIYSKYKATQSIQTKDPYTSVCHKFKVADNEIVIYATIIGTWGIKYQDEIARVELDDFKKDCESILTDNKNVFTIGDFNTSFIESEKRQLRVIKSRKEILDFTNNLDVFRATEHVENCIDHIFISNNIKLNSTSSTGAFLESNILKDDPHKGIILNVNFRK